MKRLLTLLLAVASLAAVSCQKEQEVKTDNTEKGLVKVTVLAQSPDVKGDTRTSLADNGSLYWSYGDHICVYDGTACHDFASAIQQGDDPTKVTTFSGEIQSGATNFIAVYPYTESVSYANNKIVTSIPATQYAVAGSFANQANVAIATGTSGNEVTIVNSTEANAAFIFNNVGALVKFTISQNNVHKGVTLRAFTKEGEVKTYAKIAGEVQITPSTAVAVATENSVDAVSVEAQSGYLAAGDYYAIILPIEDQYLSFTFSNGKKSKSRTAKSVVTIDRSAYYDMGTIDNGFAYYPVDVLTNATTGISGTNYDDWSNKTKDTEGSGIQSDAVYAGLSAGGTTASGACIQLRDKNSNEGIISTTSGGYVRKISVEWNSETADGRTLYVYGKNEAYSGVSALFNNNNQGTLLGEIVRGDNQPTELSISDNYQYVGLRSKSGAMYLDEIRIEWETNPTIAVAKTSISDVVAAGVTDASESAVYTLKNGATDSDVTVTCDESIVTAASKNNGAITYTVAANTGAARDGWIKVKYGNEDAHTITVNQLAATYTLTVANVENGTISATVDESDIAEGNSLIVACGSEVTLTQSASATYDFEGWDVYKTGDSETKVTVSNASFTMPEHAVTVSATFVGVQTISMKTSSIDDVAAAGVSATVAAYNLEHNASNDAVEVTCDGVIVTTATKNNATAGSIDYTVYENTGVARNGWIKVKYGTEEAHTITVNQLAATYTLTVASVDNGTISATVGSSVVAMGSSLTVACGSTVTLSQEAATNYTFSAWDVYNTETTTTKVSLNETSFTMPDYPVTVSASFTAASPKKTYTLTLSASDIDVTDSSKQGYARYNGSHSKNAVASDNSTFEVVFTTSQVMPNSGNIQFQASAGTLYNTVDLGTITNVSAGNSNLTVIIGSSENPTTASTTDKKGYFVIKKTNSGVASTSTITITFEK